MTSVTGLEQIYEVGQRLKENVGQIIVGKEEAVELALSALLCQGHILMDDVPGLGKTTLARTLAHSLYCTFGRLQCTPDLMPSDIVGVSYYNQKSSEFEFRPGPIFVQVLLADEINRATPRTQSALLEALQEGQVTVEGRTMMLPFPFLVVATQNPVELEGTFPLPEAQLDRFMIRLRLGYPSLEEEDAILLRFGATHAPTDVAPVIEAEDLRSMQQAVSSIAVQDEVRYYLLSIVRATRDHSLMELGASPRAALALYKISQALAALEGRDYVLPDDVKRASLPVLSHRLILNAQGRLRGGTGDQVVADIVESIPVPI